MNSKMLALAVHDFQRANSELLACALVYGVGHPALYSELNQWFGSEMSASRLALIFDARSEDGSSQYGPFLVRLAQGATQPSKLLRKLAESCAVDFRSVSFLFSALEFENLAEALRNRLDVVCEDGSEWQMKYFDTRSLDVLDRALSDEQRSAFLCIAKEWWYLNRVHQLKRVEGAGSKADLFRAPLSLSEKQTITFTDAGLPDSVLYTLCCTDSDLLTEFDARTRYEICERAIDAATEKEKSSAVLLADCVRASLVRALGNAD